MGQFSLLDQHSYSKNLCEQRPSFMKWTAPSWGMGLQSVQPTEVWCDGEWRRRSVSTITQILSEGRFSRALINDRIGPNTQSYLSLFILYLLSSLPLSLLLSLTLSFISLFFATSTKGQRTQSYLSLYSLSLPTSLLLPFVAFLSLSLYLFRFLSTYFRSAPFI